jgi:N-acetylmuramoyl-L-alanine amidase
MTGPVLALPQRCEIGHGGRLTGPVAVTCNDPWPCLSGTPGGFVAPALGLVIHTEAGYEQGTISWFQNPANQASATFAVGLGGAVWQFGPVGQGWEAWAQEAGNVRWVSVEDADNTHPGWPFTAAQLRSLALIVEAVSRFAGFPLEAAFDPFTQGGVALHSEGGVAWGDHPDCPGPVRAHQRHAVLAMARAIRSPPPGPGAVPWAADGKTALGELAAQHNVPASTVIRLTCDHGGVFAPGAAHWIDSVFTDPGAAVAPVPEGTVLYVPPAGPAGM